MSGPGRRYSDGQILEDVRRLAGQLGRTPLERDWRAAGLRPSRSIIFNRWGRWDNLIAEAGLPAIEAGPGWQHRGGRRVYWTPERVEAGIRAVAAELGRVPFAAQYRPLKKGRLDWPTEQKILDFGGGVWAAAFRKAGVKGVSFRWSPWTEEEETFLLEHAGALPLKQIGRRLGRSWGACKRRLYDMGVRARDARGYYTGQQLAQHLNVSRWRIYAAVRAGRLKATRTGPYLQIDPRSVERNLDWLREPKKTHKRTPPVVTDWYAQNDIRRDGQGRIVGRRQPRRQLSA